MKRAKKILMAMLFALMTCAFATADSQERPTANNTTQERYGDASDNYGWIGLLGLVGLFGLMKKTRETHSNYTQPATKSY